MMTRDALWTVVVIVESDNDGRAIRRLAETAGLPVRISILPAGSIGELKRRGEKLIALAQDRILNGRGCVAVVADGDNKDVIRDEPHRSIATTCSRMGVPFVVARQAIEAWLLGDPGIRNWLGLPNLTSPETLSNPKKRLLTAYRKKTGRAMGAERVFDDVIPHSVGIEGGKCQSWRSAVAHLSQCGLVPR